MSNAAAERLAELEKEAAEAALVPWWWEWEEQQECMTQLSEPKMDCPRCGQLSKRCTGRLQLGQRSEAAAPPKAPPASGAEDDASASADYARQVRPKGRRCKQVVCRRCPQGCRDARCSEFEKVAPLLSSLLKSTRRPRPMTALARPPRTPQALDATGRIKDLRPRRRVTRDHALQVRARCRNWAGLHSTTFVLDLPRPFPMAMPEPSDPRELGAILAV